MTNPESVLKKQRQHFATKLGPYSQNYVFSQYSCMDMRVGP